MTTNKPIVLHGLRMSNTPNSVGRIMWVQRDRIEPRRVSHHEWPSVRSTAAQESASGLGARGTRHVRTPERDGAVVQ